jgi:hypothetical protein
MFSGGLYPHTVAEALAQAPEARSSKGNRVKPFFTKVTEG